MECESEFLQTALTCPKKVRRTSCWQWLCRMYLLLALCPLHLLCIKRTKPTTELFNLSRKQTHFSVGNKFSVSPHLLNVCNNVQSFCFCFWMVLLLHRRFQYFWEKKVTRKGSSVHVSEESGYLSLPTPCYVLGERDR